MVLEDEATTRRNTEPGRGAAGALSACESLFVRLGVQIEIAQHYESDLRSTPIIHWDY